MPDDDVGLRERKKRRTRLALTDAALRLFRDQGYEQTTVAQIAAAADVSTRTFFSYFPTKEDVLFGDTDERLRLLGEAIAEAPPQASLTDVLRAAVADVFDSPAGLFGPDGTTRARLVLDHPGLRAKALHRVIQAHREIADWLRARTADTGDRPDTVAGAVLGGLIAATLAALRRDAHPDTLRTELHHALDQLDRLLAPPDERPGRAVGRGRP